MQELHNAFCGHHQLALGSLVYALALKNALLCSLGS